MDAITLTLTLTRDEWEMIVAGLQADDMDYYTKSRSLTLAAKIETAMEHCGLFGERRTDNEHK